MQDKHIDRQRLNKLAADIRANWQAHNMTDMWKLGEEQEQRLLDTYHKEITTEQLAILERLKRESRELIEFNKTEPLNVGEIQNVELIRAVPIEAIQQQIDRIGGSK